MKYTEEFKNLFSVPDEYCLAHCISADFGMGKGIVVEFNKRFDMKRILQKKYPDYLDYFRSIRKGTGDCLLENRVFNLITKERYFEKPTYKSLKQAMKQMKTLCEKNNIQKIAMPTIGCGLDRLQWNKVSQIVQDVFKDTDIEILVCRGNVPASN